MTTFLVKPSRYASREEAVEYIKNKLGCSPVFPPEIITEELALWLKKTYPEEKTIDAASLKEWRMKDIPLRHLLGKWRIKVC